MRPEEFNIELDEEMLDLIDIKKKDWLLCYFVSKLKEF